MLPDFSIEKGKATAERIRRAIEESRPGKDIAVTASIGVASSGNLEAPSAESFLDAADEAMYESKKLEPVKPSAEQKARCRICPQWTGEYP